MKRFSLALGVIVSLVSMASFADGFDHDHRAWTETLKLYQDSRGMVRYASLKSDLAKNKAQVFSGYLGAIQRVSLKDFNSWNQEQQMAFLINAYNALTLKLIVDHYPVSSIKKVGGLFKKPWSIEFFSLLGGKIKSLDPIEHEWLRPRYKDYRIHAAVNCASISCPPLRGEAFVAARLGQQLDEQMRVWLKDPSRNLIEVNSRTATISKIFDWYEKDFVEWGGGVVAVIQKYGAPTGGAAVPKDLKIKYMTYDWGLNEAK